MRPDKKMWSIGVMEYWSVGMMNAGVLEYWSNGKEQGLE
jgi:hypothetical protein